MQNIRKRILNADDLHFLHRMQQPGVMFDRCGPQAYKLHPSIRPTTNIHIAILRSMQEHPIEEITAAR